MNPGVLLILNAACSFFMAGLIWMVQLVHYPLFANVGAANFLEYERQHAMRISFIVVPVMLLELVTSFALIVLRPRSIPVWALAVGAALVVMLWLSTLLLQSPKHGRLALGFDAAVLSSLIATNWIRTAGWSLRSLLAAWMLWLGMGRAVQ